MEDADMAEDLSDAIAENAAAPAQVSTDAGTVRQHPLSDQIEADRYLASKEAVTRPTRGLRFNKLVPPGAV
jgi:hypothetical protein